MSFYDFSTGSATTSHTDLKHEMKPYRILSWSRIKNIKAVPVNLLKSKQSEYREIGRRLFETCIGEKAVGLAAPQVGIFKRLFIMQQFDEENTPKFLYTVFINPSWKPALGSVQNIETEFCLSVPAGQGYPIKRHSSIIATGDFINNDGKIAQKETVMSGQMARIFQHEYSHLNGISIPQLWKSQQQKPKKKRKSK